MVVQLSLEDFIGRSDNEIGFVAVELPKLFVGQGGCFLQHTEPADYFYGEDILTDGKMDQRPGGLGTPIAIGGHLDLTHAVGLDACFSSFLGHSTC